MLHSDSRDSSNVLLSREEHSAKLVKPSVSFIIPVFNDETNIGRCVRSIQALRCSERQYEIIVLDNGSTDATHDRLKELGISFEVIAHGHVSALRNRGAQLAQGDFLAFVDSDVELSPDWIIQGLVEFHNPDIVAVGCFPGIPERATWVQRAWDIHQRGRQPQRPEPIAWLPSMNLMVRRDVFWAVGGFNEELETAEDVDLCYRLSEKGMIVNHPMMKAIHWGEARTLTIFWKKEVWRGIGNVKGLFSHGFRLDELPSLGYPLYTLCMVLATVAGWMVDWGSGQVLWGLVALSLLILPGIVLAGNTVKKSGRPRYFLSLFVLYVTYGLARAFSLIKASLPRCAER